MPTPRRLLVDPEEPCCYHITSRCVRRAWLLGKDPGTGRNVDHRKKQLVDWLHAITPSYAVSVLTYAVMSNHFHLVIYYDPQASKSWSDEDVARRWIGAHPSLVAKKEDAAAVEEAVQRIVSDPEWVARCRRQLGSLSAFMKCLKQPIAQRANSEDELDGHFWSKRFYSGAILTDEALLSVMAYVDLNPIRAKVSKLIERTRHTGLAERLGDCAVDQSRLDAYLEPCTSGIERCPALPKLTFDRYRAFVESLVALEDTMSVTPQPLASSSRLLGRAQRWRASKQMLRRQPRVVGDASSIGRWVAARGFRRRETVLPAISV